MNLKRLIKQTFSHYFWTNFATSAGIAITTAVICGALIIGDSLEKSLIKIVDYRLGNITHTITSGDRIFTQGFSERINLNESFEATPVLKSEAIISIQGGTAKVEKVQVWGINNTFANVQSIDTSIFKIGESEAVISQNLSKQLQLKAGDVFLMNIKKTGPIPGNTPFVSEKDQTITQRVTVKSVVGKDQLGQFNLKTSQTSPFNIFVNISWLNQIMDLNGKANMVLIKAEENFKVNNIKLSCQEAFVAEDINLVSEYNSENNQTILTSERVFIDGYAANSIKEKFPEANSFLTYFVNSLGFNENETPYSFVSAVENDKFNLKFKETIINEWLAKDLNARIGDSIKMRYFVFGPLRKLIEKETSFLVSEIISMDVAEKDKILMPNLPGLSDAGNCRDWEAGIPINLDKIRDKDEDYWNVYKGTPKAYISLESGQKLWENQFGTLTSLIVPGYVKNELNRISDIIDPFKLEFQVNEVREKGRKAAVSGVDFGQLFAGLGMFIIASGLLLTILLFSLNLKRRESQIKLYNALGFSKKLIGIIVFSEIFGISIVGAATGLIISIGYSKLILLGLNMLWQDIVRTDVIELHFNAVTLAVGFFSSVFLGMIVVWFGTKKTINRINNPAETVKKIHHGTKLKVITKYLAYGLFLISLFFGVVLIISSSTDNIFAWFVTGILLLLSILLAAYYFLFSSKKRTSQKLSKKNLAWKNLTRNPNRSFTILTILALGSFVIIVTALNRKEKIDNTNDLTNGTGGFEYLVETTFPILRDLNETETKKEYGIPDSIEFIQFFSAFDDDASCLNLNLIANPKILAVEPGKLNGRFSFVKKHPSVEINNPWLSLNNSYGDLIPAIADQTVIQWGLGKKVGDTLQYTNNKGEKVRLLLIGGLSNSIFQGNVIISDKYFSKHFNTGNGSGFILIDNRGYPQQNITEDLGIIFKDKGWVMTGTLEKMAEFSSIENTYLNIFFLMGAFGMLLGTIGLAIVIVKSMLERRNELALMKSLGFKNKIILRILLIEYLTLFLSGSIAGTLTAFIAALPTFINGNHTVSVGFLFSVISILILNGVLWIFVVSNRIINESFSPEALRND